MTSEEDVPGCFGFLKRRMPAIRSVKSLEGVGPVRTVETKPHDHFGEDGLGCAGICDFSVPEIPAGKSLEDPPQYNWGRYTVDEAASKAIEDKIEEISDELRTLSLKIHEHPELGFQEKYAHTVLTDFMESHDFEVTRHYCGLETAWLATVRVGKGGRTLGFNSEMDALPGIGHACGHNLIAIGGVAAAIGVATALKKCNISGRVSLIGTPAEEGGAGKVLLLNKGAYKDFAACLMIHPGPGAAHSTGVGSSLAIERLDAEFAGQTAHAAAAPWEGRNSLDAAFVAYSAISALRQQIKPTHRVHGIVQGRDWAANIIPDYSKLTYLVRAPTYVEVAALEPRVKACFEAAAHATNTKLTYGTTTLMYDLFQNGALALEYRRVCEERYGMKVLMNADGAIGGSTDFGNITYAVPGLHPAYAIPTQPEGGNHTRGFTAAAATKEAHEATLFAAKGIALAGLRVLLDADFATQVKKDFDEGKSQY